MTLTTVTVTHTFTNADGTAASGTVLFTLSKRVTNGGTTVLPGEIVTQLDGSGHLSQALVANTDAGTMPTDSLWQVDLRLAGISPETFFITVPAGAGTVDLGTLLPQQPDGG